MTTGDNKDPPMWGFQTVAEFLLEIRRWENKGFLHMGSGTFYDAENHKRFRIIRKPSGDVITEDMP